MKNINRLKIALVALFMVAFGSSCEDILGDGINANPNSPTAVPISVVLPAAQVNVVDVTGGAFSRFSSVILQQTEGVARQWVSINNYSSLNPATLNTAWNNVYENILIELKLVKTEANNNGFGNYEGVTNVLLAYTLMMSSDVWDNIPYSEALNGTENLSPNFDTQAAIYAEVSSLLTSGITLLSGEDGGLPVGSEDVIYGGDLPSWIKAANSLLARMHLHQGNYAEALTALSNGFTSSDDNLAYTYPDATNSGQWYRFNLGRTGDIEFHPTMRALMTSLNDNNRLEALDQTFDATHPYLVPTYEQEL
ncbi:MAG: SusD/RagB family nutrient-binding outer membrane lipoprotein, partial [Cyclobacteriaceae bacterium]